MSINDRVPVADNPRIGDIVEAVRDHIKDFPNHGHDCTCYDEPTRKVRKALDLPLVRDYGSELKLEMAVRGILLRAMRH